MKIRIISGLIMAPIVLAVLLLGGKVLWGACLLITLIGIREFYNGFAALDIRPGYGMGYLFTIALYLLDLTGLGFAGSVIWIFGVILAGLLYLFYQFEERKLVDSMATIIGTLYVAFFLHFLVWIDPMGREFQTGSSEMSWGWIKVNPVLLLVFLTAFATDTMAYFTGSFFGRHKLCPVISPKKTVEGSIGGIVGSVVLCGIFALWLAPELLVDFLILGGLGGVVSQFGDLTASIFKRKMGIKDYGTLIPGHGGVMDRFDSVLFTAPLVFLYFLIKAYITQGILG